MLNGPGWGLDELEEDLPNGFHDAEVEAIHYDLLVRTVSLQLLLWVGTMDDPPKRRELYRRGTLIFDKVKFFAKSAPHDASDAGLTILSCGRNGDLAQEYKADAPCGDDCYRIFTGYCELDIECASCQFIWVEAEATNRSSEQL